MAVSTRWNLLAGFSAAVLALTACGDSGSNNNEDTDGGGNGGNGNGSINAGNNANGGQNNGGQGEGGMQMPVADLDDNVAGKGCNSDADCSGTGATCASMIGGIAGFGGQVAEGGYCTGACNDDTSCGAGGACVGALGGILPGQCQKACSADSDCREADGYVCSDNDIPIPEGGLPMTDGGMVPAIPEQPSTCLPKPDVADLDDGVVGKPCAADTECTGTGGVCNTTVTTGGFMGMGGMMVTYPGGYCSGACAEDADCGATGECVGVIPILSPTGTCALRCANTKECGREGYRCAAGASFPGAPAGDKVCQPGAAPTATASIAAFNGALAGTAKFSMTATGAKLEVTLTNCPDGVYAVQIHTGAMCSAYGDVWDTARGTISDTITCTGMTGTFTTPVERNASVAATKWSIDEGPATDVGGHTLLVYANPIAAAPLACGPITNAP